MGWQTGPLIVVAAYRGEATLGTAFVGLVQPSALGTPIRAIGTRPARPLVSGDMFYHHSLVSRNMLSETPLDQLVYHALAARPTSFEEPFFVDPVGGVIIVLALESEMVLIHVM